jgi:hypothetical protein
MALKGHNAKWFYFIYRGQKADSIPSAQVALHVGRSILALDDILDLQTRI